MKADKNDRTNDREYSWLNVAYVRLCVYFKILTAAGGRGQDGADPELEVCGVRTAGVRRAGAVGAGAAGRDSTGGHTALCSGL